MHGAFARELVPLADVILQSAFELGALSGIATTGAQAVVEGKAALGRPAVVTTSRVAAALARISGEPWAEMPITAALDAIVSAGAER